MICIEIYQYHFIHVKLDIKQQKFDFPLIIFATSIDFSETLVGINEIIIFNNFIIYLMRIRYIGIRLLRIHIDTW